MPSYFTLFHIINFVGLYLPGLGRKNECSPFRRPAAARVVSAPLTASGSATNESPLWLNGWGTLSKFSRELHSRSECVTNFRRACASIPSIPSQGERGNSEGLRCKKSALWEARKWGGWKVLTRSLSYRRKLRKRLTRIQTLRYPHTARSLKSAAPIRGRECRQRFTFTTKFAFSGASPTRSGMKRMTNNREAIKTASRFSR